MNDHDSMTQINHVLDAYLNGSLTAETAMFKIAHISGQNVMDHFEAQP